MDDPALQVECPHCGAVFNVADGPGGRQVTCPVCRGAVTVLDVQEEAPGTATAEHEQEHEHERAATVGSYFARDTADDEDGPWMVCCSHEGKINPLVVRPLLRSFCGLSARDAARQVTHGMGILAEGLAPDTARRLAEALESKGIEAFAVPAARAPEPADQVRFLSVQNVDERGLHLQTDPKGTVRALGWESVVAGVCTKDLFGGHRVVSYVHRAPSTYATVYTGATYSGFGLRVEEHDVPAPTTLTLVLHDGHGRLHTMKVTADHVHYAYLGERLQTNRDTNFLLFLTDVGRHAQHAYFPPSYIQVAGGHTLALKEPGGRVEYNNYLRWAVCCAIAQGLSRLSEGE